MVIGGTVGQEYRWYSGTLDLHQLVHLRLRKESDPLGTLDLHQLVHLRLRKESDPLEII